MHILYTHICTLDHARTGPAFHAATQVRPQCRAAETSAKSMEYTIIWRCPRERAHAIEKERRMDQERVDDVDLMDASLEHLHIALKCVCVRSCA